MIRLQVAYRWKHHIAAVLLLTVTLVGGSIDQARAQLPSGQSTQLTTAWGPIEVIANPYIWLPWTSVDVQSAGASASQTISPGDLISHLTWVPFMGAANFAAARSVWPSTMSTRR